MNQEEVERAIQEAKAAAWDEGYAAGDMPCETAVPCGDCPTCNAPVPTNPYTPV